MLLIFKIVLAFYCTDQILFVCLQFGEGNLNLNWCSSRSFPLRPGFGGSLYSTGTALTSFSPNQIDYNLSHSLVPSRPFPAKLQSHHPSHPHPDFITHNLIPLPCRFRAWTPRRTPLISPTGAQPLLCTQLQLAIQLITRILAMDEIAEAASYTPLPAIQPTASLSEIRNRTKFAVDRTSRIPARV